MHPWTVLSNSDARSYAHTFAGAGGHALFSTIASAIFQTLRVSASLFDGRLWWGLHHEPNLTRFETEHGKDAERYRYNGRIVAEVLRRKRAVRGSHAGTCDCFVPVVMDGRVVAILVVGPFAVARPTSLEITERWRRLTGCQADPTDPQFAFYLNVVCSTLTLEGDMAAQLERMLTLLAALLAERGRADALANQLDALRIELEKARVVDRMWETTRDMLDERFARGQYRAAVAHDMKGLGVQRATDQILVGLMVDRGADSDPVARVLRRDAFQRSAVHLARGIGNVVSGRVGDHGVVFVAARRRSLDELARRARSEAERFGLSLHFGASPGTGSTQLWSKYQAALGAAQAALSKDLRIVFSDEPPARGPGLLRNLREELARDVEARAATLAARFDRYAESVAVHCAHRMDPSRAELEIAFERISDILLRSGAVDPKSLSAMGDLLDRAAGQARNLNELLAAYRRAVADMAQALERPAPARQDRRLRAALSYIECHYSEKLNLKQVARLSGFAPTYFSELFAKREKRTFGQHVLGLRMERAKQLLTGTDLSATRVAELSGFGSPQYFSRVFRKSARVTPLEYRYRVRTDWAEKRSKGNRSKDKDGRTPAR